MNIRPYQDILMEYCYLIFELRSFRCFDIEINARCTVQTSTGVFKLTSRLLFAKT